MLESQINPQMIHSMGTLNGIVKLWVPNALIWHFKSLGQCSLPLQPIVAASWVLEWTFGLDSWQLWKQWAGRTRKRRTRKTRGKGDLKYKFGRGDDM